jgi:hypothetical protein
MQIVGLLHYNNDFIGIIQQFLEILVIFEEYWSLFKTRSWGEVGRWLPTSDLYKLVLLEAMGGDSEKVMLKICQSKAIFM